MKHVFKFVTKYTDSITIYPLVKLNFHNIYLFNIMHTTSHPTVTHSPINDH